MRRREFLKTVGVGASVLAGAGLAGAEGGGVVLKSPDGKLEAVIFVGPLGRLCCRLASDGVTIVEEGALGVTVDGDDLGLRVSLAAPTVENSDETYALRGNHAQARNHSRRATIPIVHEGTAARWELEVRLFNDGLAFRYLVPGEAARTISGEATAFVLPAGSTAYYQDQTQYYEGLFQRAAIAGLRGNIGLPVTVALPGSDFAVITEAALYHYSGMTINANGRLLRGIFEDDNAFSVEPRGGVVASPWRVIMVSPDLNGLVNSDIIPNLNPPPSPELFGDAGWIQPGRALWSWWSQNTGGPGRQRRYIDAASKLGFEYILVDEGWELWPGFGKDKWALIEELCAYGAARGVRVWVWKHWQALGEEGARRDFFDRVRNTGAAGIKIDFMNSESKARIEFYEAALADAARRRLMVNFHGANKPTGEARTYPNEMTREGVRGMEYNRAPGKQNVHPDYNVTLPFVRGLAGHADYTPVTFHPAKMRGSTFAHQLAMPIVYLSPLTHYADNPKYYLDNPAVAPALDVLKSIPTVWDETVVLQGSEIGRLALFARRSGRRWFVGAMAGLEAGPARLDLTFLGDGGFQAIVLTDRPDNKGFAREEKKVDAATLLSADLQAGGGLVAVLEPSA